MRQLKYWTQRLGRSERERIARTDMADVGGVAAEVHSLPAVEQTLLSPLIAHTQSDLIGPVMPVLLQPPSLPQWPSTTNVANYCILNGDGSMFSWSYACYCCHQLLSPSLPPAAPYQNGVSVASSLDTHFAMQKVASPSTMMGGRSECGSFTSDASTAAAADVAVHLCLDWLLNGSGIRALTAAAAAEVATTTNAAGGAATRQEDASDVVTEQTRLPGETVFSLLSNKMTANLEWLTRFAAESNRAIQTVNGQRVTGPPVALRQFEPENGSEIFVGHLPYDVFETELIPLLSDIGTIYRMRLMLHFSGANRGYCFVRYAKRSHAVVAVERLNNHMIRPGVRIGVVASVDNCKLYVRGIPKDATGADIKVAFQAMTSGVVDVVLYKSPTCHSRARRYAFVEYATHRDAAVARRQLMPVVDRIFVCGEPIESVEWAEPEWQVDHKTMSKVQILFIRHLAPSTDERRIRHFFANLLLLRYTDDAAAVEAMITRVRKVNGKDYAFVHFASREAAEAAIDLAKQTPLIDGHVVDIAWSRPVDKREHLMRKCLNRSSDTFGDEEQGDVWADATIQRQSHVVGPPPLSSIFVRRRRGAAGISGIGPPGTEQSRRMMERLLGTLNRWHWDN